jgi:hypothetical protein
MNKFQYFDIEYNAWRWREAYDHLRTVVSKKRKIFVFKGDVDV